MVLKSYHEDDFFVLAIEGDLDASSCIKLDEAISSAVANNERKILIDCQSLNYISSAGLGVFMSYLQEFKEKGISLVLFNVSDKVKKVFQILGLNELITIVDSKDEAKHFANEP